MLHFVGQEKALVLNRTNGRVVEALYGDDTDDWTGCPIRMVAATTEFGGRAVDCIRLRPSTCDDLKEAEFA